MSMSKKDFIALADRIKAANQIGEARFTSEELDVLASFCRERNHNFKTDRWLGYIAGENGSNGGKVK